MLSVLGVSSVMKYTYINNLKVKEGVTLEIIKELSNKYYSNQITLDDAAKTIGYTEFGLRNLFKRFGLKLTKTEHTKHYIFDETYFDDINSELKAYFLGFIMADGCVYIGKKNDHLLRIHIKDSDDEIIIRLLKEIKLNKKITYKNGTAEIKIFSKRVINSLIKLGCTPRKSLTLEFPNISKEFLPHFIRGYFDGDGTVCHGRRGKYFWTRVGFYSSYSFNAKLRDILINTYNIPCIINKKYKICEVATGHGEKTRKLIYDLLYKDATFFLKRKKDKFIEIFDLYG